MYRLNRLVRGIGRRTADMLSWDIMSGDYHVLMANFVLLLVYTTIESTFVNTLLYTVHPGIAIVIFYRAIVYTVTALCMHLAAYVAQKKTPLTVVRLGAAFYLLTYALLFFGLDHMQTVMIPTAILSGTGGAFYWVGHNQLVPRYTSQRNREVGMSIIGILQGVTQLIVPVVSGYIISWTPGSTGYRIMFGVGVATALLQMRVQRRMAPVEQPRHDSKARLAFKMLFKKRSFKLMFAFESLRGVREGAFAFLLNMLLFEIVTDESLVGINTFLTGAAAILGSWVYGRAVRRKMRGRVMLLATAILIGACIPLYFVMLPATLMAFTVLSSFFTLFAGNACSNTVYDIVGQNATTRKCMGEAIAIRENALWVGRMVGLGILMALPHTQKGYIVSILILTFAQLLAGFAMVAAMRTIDRKPSATEVTVLPNEPPASAGESAGPAGDASCPMEEPV